MKNCAEVTLIVNYVKKKEDLAQLFSQSPEHTLCVQALVRSSKLVYEKLGQVAKHQCVGLVRGGFYRKSGEGKIEKRVDVTRRE